MSLRTAGARDRCLAAADQRRRQHAGSAGEAPGGAGHGGAGGLAGRASHDAAAVVPGDSRRLRSVEGDPAHPRVRSPMRFTSRPRGRSASGPIGWLRRHGPALHHQLSHALRRVPERARCPVPLEWGYKLVRWFHARAAAHAGQLDVAAARAARAARRTATWCTGRAASTPSVFHPAHRRDEVYDLPRPIWLYVGRVAVEKSLEDFLALPLPGTKVVVGDGPSRERAAAALSRRRVARLSLRRRPGRALRQRRLLRVSVAHRDLRQRAAGGDGVGPAGRVGARARSGRHRRRKASTARSTTTCWRRACARCAARATKRARASRTAR